MIYGTVVLAVFCWFSSVCKIKTPENRLLGT
jgi:hypothetical protein